MTEIDKNACGRANCVFADTRRGCHNPTNTGTHERFFCLDRPPATEQPALAMRKKNKRRLRETYILSNSTTTRRGFFFGEQRKSLQTENLSPGSNGQADGYLQVGKLYKIAAATPAVTAARLGIVGPSLGVRGAVGYLFLDERYLSYSMI